jgi:hypothetical protein
MQPNVALPFLRINPYFIQQLARHTVAPPRSWHCEAVVRKRRTVWIGASQRRVLEIPLSLVLHRGRKALRSAARSFGSDGPWPSQIQTTKSRCRGRVCASGCWKPRRRSASGLCAAAKPYLYLDRLHGAALKDLGISGNAGKEKTDLYVRIPGNRESAFRGVVRKNGVPVSDILQVWPDVSRHPSRGKEKADLIWRRVLSPALESREPAANKISNSKRFQNLSLHWSLGVLSTNRTGE